jgi:predicted DNA-binding transcriptional regulator AlpA
MAEIIDREIKKLLTRAEVAEMTGVSLPGLIKMEKEGRGPVVLKIGRMVRYRPSDVDAWWDGWAVPPTPSINPSGVRKQPASAEA